MNNKINIGLWIAQGLMALLFFMAGFSKIATPIDQLALNMGWVLDIAPGLVRFIGVAELLGAIGLILPAATRIQPKLTVAAAGGLVLVMIFAAIFHLTRGEYSSIVPNIIFALINGGIAYGRLNKAPIMARS